MNTLRHITYNLLDYRGSTDPITREDPQLRERLALVRETINCTGGDVYSIQEMKGDTPADRLAAFVELAETMGFEYRATDQHGVLRPVFDPGQRSLGVGVMWRPDGIEPVAGALRTFERTLSNGMAMVRLRIDGVEVTVASSHLPPAMPYLRIDMCIYIAVRIMEAGEHGIVGCDWNNILGVPMFGAVYEDDPYESHPWHPRHIGKACPDGTTGNGYARTHAVRAAYDAGLYDPAAYIKAPHYRTTGHWGDAINKRIDGPMVTKSVADAARSITSFDDVPAYEASDHLPVMVEIDLDTLAAT